MPFFSEEIVLGPNNCHTLKKENVSSLKHGIHFDIAYLTSLNLEPVFHLVVVNLKMVVLKVGLNRFITDTLAECPPGGVSGY